MVPSKSLATCKSLIMTALTDLAERLRPSIIGVRRGGSGVVVAPGVAVTLWRNVRAGDATVALAGGEAELLGADRSADLAALRVDPSLPPVPWSDAGPLRIGDPVFALADPAGRGLRATAGAVSSAPRAGARTGRPPDRGCAGAHRAAPPRRRRRPARRRRGRDPRAERAARRRRPDRRLAGERAARARASSWPQGARRRRRRWASPWPARARRAGCAPPPGWPRSRACSSARSRRAAPRRERASPAAT